MAPLTELNELDDVRLMQHVADGDPAALEVLYRRYAAPILGLAYKMLNDRASAEEVVQETFWRVWLKGHLFRKHRGKFTSWLFGIARNLCIDLWRRHQARPQTIPHQEDGLEHNTFVNGNGHRNGGGNGSGNGHRNGGANGGAVGGSYSRADSAAVGGGDVQANPEEWAWAAIRRQQIRSAVTRLPEAQRQVIEMAFFGEMTHQQIADTTGVPLGTVHTRARLALQKLRRSLASQRFEA